MKKLSKKILFLIIVVVIWSICWTFLLKNTKSYQKIETKSWINYSKIFSDLIDDLKDPELWNQVVELKNWNKFADFTITYYKIFEKLSQESLEKLKNKLNLKNEDEVEKIRYIEEFIEHFQKLLYDWFKIVYKSNFFENNYDNIIQKEIVDWKYKYEFHKNFEQYIEFIYQNKDSECIKDLNFKWKNIDYNENDLEIKKVYECWYYTILPSIFKFTFKDAWNVDENDLFFDWNLSYSFSNFKNKKWVVDFFQKWIESLSKSLISKNNKYMDQFIEDIYNNIDYYIKLLSNLWYNLEEDEIYHYEEDLF